MQARNEIGAILVETAFSLGTLVLSWIALCILAMSVSLACFYRIKVGHIANEVAIFAADRAYSINRKRVREAANWLLERESLPHVSKCRFDRFDSPGRGSVVVEIEVDSLPLVNHDLLPKELVVSEKRSALLLTTDSFDFRAEEHSRAHD